MSAETSILFNGLPVSEDVVRAASIVRFLVLDVDGVCTDGKLYFAGAMQLDYTNHISIAKSLQPVIERITDNKGIPIAILTDNARNLKLAATDRSQPGPTIDTGLQVCSVQSLTRQNMLHISCSVHSANLILKDIEKEIPDFIDFKKGIKNLFAFLRHRNVRQKLKCHAVHEKVDRTQEIKWLTYYHAFTMSTNTTRK